MPVVIVEGGRCLVAADLVSTGEVRAGAARGVRWERVTVEVHDCHESEAVEPDDLPETDRVEVEAAVEAAATAALGRILRRSLAGGGGRD